MKANMAAASSARNMMRMSRKNCRDKRPHFYYYCYYYYYLLLLLIRNQEINFINLKHLRKVI